MRYNALQILCLTLQKICEFIGLHYKNSMENLLSWNTNNTKSLTKVSTMDTNFPIRDTTEKAKTIDADGSRPQIGAEKYPWRALPEGKSFFIDTKIHVVKLQTMQSAASRWSKKLNRRFRVVAHESWIEVARLSDNQIINNIKKETDFRFSE